MRQVTEDRRTRKTKAAIEKAFLSLMLKKDINKITIRDITDMADTNRSTFYTHYDDIYDLLNSIEDRIISEMCLVESNNLLYKILHDEHIDITKTLNYIKDNKDILRILMHSSRSMMFVKKLTLVIETLFVGNMSEKEIPQSKEQYRDLMLSFFFNGIIAVLSDWLRDDTSKFTPEEINTFIEMTVNPIIKSLCKRPQAV